MSSRSSPPSMTLIQTQIPAKQIFMVEHSFTAIPPFVEFDSSIIGLLYMKRRFSDVKCKPILLWATNLWDLMSAISWVKPHIRSLIVNSLKNNQRIVFFEVFRAESDWNRQKWFGINNKKFLTNILCIDTISRIVCYLIKSIKFSMNLEMQIKIIVTLCQFPNSKHLSKNTESNWFDHFNSLNHFLRKSCWTISLYLSW